MKIMIEIVGKTKRLNTFKLKYCNIVKMLNNFDSQRTFSHHNQKSKCFRARFCYCFSLELTYFAYIFLALLIGVDPNTLLSVSPAFFLYFLIVWFRIRFQTRHAESDPGPQSCWKQILFLSGSTTLVLLIVFLSCIFSLLISYCPSL